MVCLPNACVQVTCAIAPVNTADAFGIFTKAGNFLLRAVGLTRTIVRRQLEAVSACAAETRPVGRRQRCNQAQLIASGLRDQGHIFAGQLVATHYASKCPIGPVQVVIGQRQTENVRNGIGILEHDASEIAFQIC
ncbi:hypothetical protein T4E_11625 [Trichinella pseudospiralis]|uniref:Uncharacterized protein n=1 Tax=Trichinella pseudospiralis TaxID=6337 RepID=A0A0V0XZ45_TRIPS|nr:hypothetical protein T4E_11625 [Trichinella pseudospiralis]